MTDDEREKKIETTERKSDGKEIPLKESRKEGATIEPVNEWPQPRPRPKPPSEEPPKDDSP